MLTSDHWKTGSSHAHGAAPKFTVGVNLAGEYSLTSHIWRLNDIGRLLTNLNLLVCFLSPKTQCL